MKAITSKQLFALSVIIGLYFSLLCVNTYVFQFDFFALGILQETLTLPFLLLQLILLVVSFLRIYRHRFSSFGYGIWSFLILLACSLFTIGSFFNHPFSQ